MSLTRTQTGLVSRDPFFDRGSTGTTIGGPWVERSGDWTIGDQAFTPPPPNRRLHITTATDKRVIEDGTEALNEQFIQCVLHPNAVFFIPAIAAKLGWNAGAFDAYGVQIGNHAANAVSIIRWQGGTAAAIGTGATQLPTDRDRLCQIFVANGIQEATVSSGSGLLIGDTDPVTVSAMLAATDGAFDDTPGAAGLVSGWFFIASGGNWYSRWLWTRGRTITVTGLPTGFQCEIVNAANQAIASIVGPGTSVNVDLYTSGAVGQVPIGGWPMLRVRSLTGQTIDQFIGDVDYSGVLPGDSFEFTHRPVFNPSFPAIGRDLIVSRMRLIV